MHLIFVEHERRLAAGKAQNGVKAEAQSLAAWIRTTHSGCPPPTPKTIENRIREAHRQRCPKAPK